MYLVYYFVLFIIQYFVLSNPGTSKALVMSVKFCMDQMKPALPKNGAKTTGVVKNNVTPKLHRQTKN